MKRQNLKLCPQSLPFDHSGSVYVQILSELYSNGQEKCVKLVNMVAQARSLSVHDCSTHLTINEMT